MTPFLWFLQTKIIFFGRLWVDQCSLSQCFFYAMSLVPLLLLTDCIQFNITEADPAATLLFSTNRDGAFPDKMSI